MRSAPLVDFCGAIVVVVELLLLLLFYNIQMHNWSKMFGRRLAINK